MDPVKIILADNQLIARKGYTYLLENHPTYCFSVMEADTKQELLEHLYVCKPDIILIDPYIFDLNSVSEIREIKHLSPKSCILVISDKIVPKDIPVILDCGVTQFILKNCSSKEFNNALEAATQGKKFLSNEILDILLFTKPVIDHKPENYRLTCVETEIVKCVAKGLSTREIAVIRNLSTHTVNTHRKNILKKLRIKNSSELILYAFQTGIAETSDYFI